MGRVQDKLVIITAAGQGIGRASALMLAREGATVIATDIREDLLEELAEAAKVENLSITVRRVDVTSKEDILGLAEGLEKVDVLFNCAGFEFELVCVFIFVVYYFRYVHQGSIFDCSDDVFERSMNINVRSMFWMCQTIAPKVPDGGSIINMSSVCSSIKGAPNRCKHQLVLHLLSMSSFLKYCDASCMSQVCLRHN